jgi:hypothetical protein
MKKAVLFLLLVFVLCCAAQSQEIKYISGGTARQLALGGSPTNPYLMDYTNIYTNPAWAAKYGDLVYSELGYNFGTYNADGQSVGFTYAIWKGLSVGLSVGKQEGPIFAINSYGGNFGGQTANSDNFIGGMDKLLTDAGTVTSPFDPADIVEIRPLQLYGALKLTNLTLGLAIYRSSWSVSTESAGTVTVNTKDEASISQTGFKIGALLDMNALLLDVSALLRINSATAKHTPPPPVAPALSGNEEINATGTEIGLNARLFMKLNEKFTLVPMARFTTFSYEPEVKYAIPAGRKLNAKPDKYSRTDFEAGVGTNVNVPGGRLFAGLSFELFSLKHDYSTFRSPATAGDLDARDTNVVQTTKNTTKIVSLPKVTIGAEFDIASWLTGRLGYFKAFASRTITTEPTGALKDEDSDTYNFQFYPTYGLAMNDQLLSLGLGLHFDRFALDGYLAEGWLADGPYVLSGENNTMFCVLSMSYCFQ